MKYKPDWEEAQGRLTALWNGERTDRPCIAVTAPSGQDVTPPDPPTNARDKWLDPDWICRDALARLEGTWWGGEAVPSYLLNGGWVVCLGGTPQFDHNTIWFQQVEVDCSHPSPFKFDPDDPWFCSFQELYSSVAEMAGRDDFLVGQACILPANDLLSMLMGTQEFLMRLVQEPDWMADAIVGGAREMVRARRTLQAGIQDRHEFWYGLAGWMPFWAPEPFAGTQSDVSCMLSPEMYDRFIVPELDVYGEAYGAVWYHLDGCDARQHLPRLLSLPYLRVVQYTPTPNEPPNGPEHLDFYRQIQDVGKIVHIELPPENIQPLAEQLDPRLALFQTNCKSIAEGEALLHSATR
jgi:hypothetical protein